MHTIGHGNHWMTSDALRPGVGGGRVNRVALLAALWLAFSLASGILICSTARAQQSPAEVPPDSAAVRQAEDQLLRKHEQTIATIVREVARGVQESSPGGGSLAEQEVLIAQVARRLAEDRAVYLAAAGRTRLKKEERDRLITNILINISKAIAIVIAILVLRRILIAMQRGMRDREEPFGVFVSAASEDEAERIGRVLVEEALVVHARILAGVQSIYRSEDRVAEASQSLLVVKTIRGHIPRIIGRVSEVHSEDAPEVIAVPAFRMHDEELLILSKATGDWKP